MSLENQSEVKLNPAQINALKSKGSDVVEQSQQPNQQPLQATQSKGFDRPHSKSESGDTFLSVESSYGTLEVDLITFREKGVEERYLAFNFNGTDIRQNPPVPQSAFLSINSKEEFEKIKNFFNKLNWED